MAAQHPGPLPEGQRGAGQGGARVAQPRRHGCAHGRGGPGGAAGVGGRVPGTTRCGCPQGSVWALLYHVPGVL